MSQLKQDIIDLRNQGLTYTEIKAKLGCSKGTISYYLGEGVKEKQNRRQNVSRGKFRVRIQEIKQNTPCADCKENYPYWIMDFDHLEDKTSGIAQLVRNVGCNEEALLREIAKCEVVCANCHRTRTRFRSKKSESKDMIDLSEYYS